MFIIMRQEINYVNIAAFKTNYRLSDGTNNIVIKITTGNVTYFLNT